MLPVSDSLVLSRYSDAVTIVVKAESTPVKQARHCIQRLGRAHAPIAGVVLNQLDFRKAQKYSDYGYGGSYESYAPAAVTQEPIPGFVGNLRNSIASLSKVTAGPFASARVVPESSGPPRQDLKADERQNQVQDFSKYRAAASDET